MTSLVSSIVVSVHPTVPQMDLARTALDRFSAVNGFSPSATGRLQIVLDELLSNIVHHGFEPPVETAERVLVAMRIKAGVVTLTFTDLGKPFDPTQGHPIPQDARPRIGGRGLEMVQSLTDTLTYRRSEGRNITKATKAISLRQDGSQTMIQGLEIEETREGDTARVSLEGRIDSGNAGQLTEHLTALVSAGHKKITLDLAKLKYLTSAGFRTLLLVSDAAEEAGGTLHLANLTEEVRELFDLSGLSRAFVIS
ncbi:anti-sigma factor antagonist [Pseudaestuariivita sp.]|uniref:anti-sigma factor antagonist n=1 Tax=Pseudaestuariivita sp. TaxID=2211669 RepID=UPI004059A715